MLIVPAEKGVNVGGEGVSGVVKHKLMSENSFVSAKEADDLRKKNERKIKAHQNYEQYHKEKQKQSYDNYTVQRCSCTSSKTDVTL